MFTGIVEELGEVVGKEDLTDAARFVIRGPLVTTDAGHGDSIAVNGVCLTVVDVLPDGAFTADVMAETLNRSSLRAVDVGSHVNLERAAALNSRLGGHIVQGHVDGTGHVLARTPSEHWEVVRIALPAAVSRYVVEKGSITVDGISLTVSALGRRLVRGLADPHHPGADDAGPGSQSVRPSISRSTSSPSTSSDCSARTAVPAAEPVGRCVITPRPRPTNPLVGSRQQNVLVRGSY